MISVWTARAELELYDIIDYIAKDKPLAAYRWGERLVERAVAAASMKNSGRIVPEIGRPEIREVIVEGYRIIYRVAEATIRVWTVLEGHRRVASDLDLDA